MNNKHIMALSAVLGISASLFVGSFMTPHKSQAAVAVIDTKNIEEAIKTAQNTMDILIQEKKKLELAIQNIKKLDPSNLLKSVESQFNQLTQLKDLESAYQGILGIKGTVEGVAGQWNTTIGSVEDIFKGSVNSGDFSSASKQAQKVVEHVNSDAVKTAQQSIDMTKTAMDSVKDSLNDVKDAEGHMQAMQATANIDAVIAQNSAQQVYLLGNISSQLAAQNQMLNADTARAKVLEEEQRKQIVEGGRIIAQNAVQNPGK